MTVDKEAILKEWATKVDIIRNEALNKYPVQMVQGEKGFGHEIDENLYEREAYISGRAVGIEQLTELRKEVEYWKAICRKIMAWEDFNKAVKYLEALKQQPIK